MTKKTFQSNLQTKTTKNVGYAPHHHPHTPVNHGFVFEMFMRSTFWRTALNYARIHSPEAEPSPKQPTLIRAPKRTVGAPPGTKSVHENKRTVGVPEKTCFYWASQVPLNRLWAPDSPWEGGGEVALNLFVRTQLGMDKRNCKLGNTRLHPEPSNRQR